MLHLLSGCQYPKQPGTWTGTVTEETAHGKSGTTYALAALNITGRTPFTHHIYGALTKTDPVLLVDRNGRAIAFNPALVGEEMRLSGVVHFRVAYGPNTNDPLYGAPVPEDTVVEYESLVLELDDPLLALRGPTSRRSPATRSEVP